MSVLNRSAFNDAVDATSGISADRALKSPIGSVSIGGPQLCQASAAREGTQ